MDGLDLGLESMVVRDENVFRGRTAEAESLEFWNNHVSEPVTTTVYYLGSLEMDITRCRDKLTPSFRGPSLGFDEWQIPDDRHVG